MNGDRNSVNEQVPEPRTAVMILVETSWEDQSGTLQKTRARMENRSPGGACIRLRKPIHVGAKLQVQWRWEQFTGTVRYCRSDGRDFLVGIQRDTVEKPITKKEAAREVSPKESEKKSERDIAALLRNGTEKLQESRMRESAETKQTEKNVPKVQVAGGAADISLAAGIRTKVSEPNPPVARARESVVLRGTEQGKQRHQGSEAGKERKHMRRKWFELGHNEENQEDGSPNVTGTGNAEPVNQTASGAGKKAVEAHANASGGATVDLLSMADIYQTTGILNPRKGYSILKVVEMLRSEHLRGLSKEMKRASVLVALDAAGISVDEVTQDARARMAAIDSYEADQRKQFEAHLARKAEENQQIMAELERVKASYSERLRRNLEGVAREKATFGNWLTTKQEESQNIREALELCLKPEATEAGSSTLDTSLVSSNAKPV
jgi:hypothetical protein